MNAIIVSTLIGLSIVAMGTVPASADTFSVHGFSTHYGR